MLVFLIYLARVICSIQYPHPVLHANKSWTKLLGFQQHDVQGKTLQILQGKLTNLDAIRQMMHNVRLIGFGSTEIANYTKDGKMIMVSIRIQPIIASNIFGEKHYSHLLGRIRQIPMVNNPLSAYDRNSLQWQGYDWMIQNTLYQESEVSDQSNEDNNDSGGDDNQNILSSGSRSPEDSINELDNLTNDHQYYSSSSSTYTSSTLSNRSSNQS